MRAEESKELWVGAPPGARRVDSAQQKDTQCGGAWRVMRMLSAVYWAQRPIARRMAGF
jgi:hypothetical protein